MIDIHWDHKYEIGHPRIDFEHRVFVDLIRTVSSESNLKSPRDRIARLLIEVKKYAEFHFVSEENIMLDVGYPDYESHKEAHRLLIAQIDDHLHRFRTGNIDLEQIGEFMFNWFALHTSREDKKIASYIGSKSGEGIQLESEENA